MQMPILFICHSDN